ncbi:hypothetical protein B0A67_02490 [Flavobacterium aquidurense]|nr:hypothetical protein B0A67_02490 [Flavobacterium aquidurense]
MCNQNDGLLVQSGLMLVSKKHEKLRFISNSKSQILKSQIPIRKNKLQIKKIPNSNEGIWDI